MLHDVSNAYYMAHLEKHAHINSHSNMYPLKINPFKLTHSIIQIYANENHNTVNEIHITNII